MGRQASLALDQQTFCFFELKPPAFKMSAPELACTYAALILHDDGIAITADKIATIVKAAGVEIEPYWPTLFAKLLERKNIEDLITNGGAAAEEEKKEESEEEESDDDMGFSLFD